MPLFHANTNRICTREALHLDTPHLPVDLPLSQQLPKAMGPYTLDFLQANYQPAPSCATSSQVCHPFFYITLVCLKQTAGRALAKDVGSADSWHGACHSKPFGDGRRWRCKIQGQHVPS